MLADIEAGIIEGSGSWDLDRLHRQPIELGALTSTLADKCTGLTLATVTGDADLSTDNGRLYSPHQGCRGAGRSGTQREHARTGSTSACRSGQGVDPGAVVRLHHAPL